MNSTPKTSWEVRLARHLEGRPTAENFQVVQVALPPIGDGQLVVRTDYLGLTATYLELMRADSKIPVPPFEVGKRLYGGSIGTVVESNSPDFKSGDVVQSMNGWCEYSVGPAEGYFKTDVAQFPDVTYHLNHGLPAYFGIIDIAKVTTGDVVFVSGAAGGVGSLAGQIAKCLGAQRVIGSAGSRQKLDNLVGELGYDAAVDYHDNVVDQLKKVAPEGIDVFFDNVGGSQLEAAIEVAKPGARFALCGELSVQTGNESLGISEKARRDADAKGITLDSFSTPYDYELMGAWNRDFAKWLDEKKLVFAHTIVDGELRLAPETFLSFLGGTYSGHVAMRITHEI